MKSQEQSPQELMRGRYNNGAPFRHSINESYNVCNTGSILSSRTWPVAGFEFDEVDSDPLVPPSRLSHRIRLGLTSRTTVKRSRCSTAINEKVPSVSEKRARHLHNMGHRGANSNQRVVSVTAPLISRRVKINKTQHLVGGDSFFRSESQDEFSWTAQK